MEMIPFSFGKMLFLLDKILNNYSNVENILDKNVNKIVEMSKKILFIRLKSLINLLIPKICDNSQAGNKKGVIKFALCF